MVTNDDGVRSPGLIASVRALLGLGDLFIAAPASPQSSMGRAFGIGPGRGVISEVSLEVDGSQLAAYSITGPPALVVAHALTELTPRLPALCVSGINHGENLGRDLQGSGTVGAAFEAEAYGIPAIAVSLAIPAALQRSGGSADVDWGTAEDVTRQIAAKVLSSGLPEAATVLNVNVPARPSSPVRWRITRQSSRRYYRAVSPGSRDWSQGLELGWAVLDQLDDVERDSDIWAVVHDGVVSITPMTWDQTVPCDWETEGRVDGQ